MSKGKTEDNQKETWEERVRNIYDRNGGTITPDMVIEDAKDPDSPLHEKFDWNLETAAMSAWRETARKIIRSVRVVVTVEDVKMQATSRSIPEFVRDPLANPRHQGFARIADIRTDEEKSISAMLYEIERIEAALNRAIGIAHGLGLIDECVGIRQALAVLKKRVIKAA